MMSLTLIHRNFYAVHMKMEQGWDIISPPRGVPTSAVLCYDDEIFTCFHDNDVLICINVLR